MSKTSEKSTTFAKSREAKAAYKRPVVTQYGTVKELTRSTGSANGDGGPTMMA
jgi:hypothetical protein